MNSSDDLKCSRLRALMCLFAAGLLLQSAGFCQNVRQRAQPKTFDELKTKAEGNDAESQFELGMMYGKGNGARKDAAEAIKWIKKAAENGHSQAQYTLGYMYESGQLMPQDYVEALIWYLKAADQGNTNAITRLPVFWSKDQVLDPLGRSPLSDPMFYHSASKSMESETKNKYTGVKITFNRVLRLSLRTLSLSQYETKYDAAAADDKKVALDSKHQFEVPREDAEELQRAFAKCVEWDATANRTKAESFTKEFQSADGLVKFKYHFSGGINYSDLWCYARSRGTSSRSFTMEDISAFQELFKALPELKIELEKSIRKKRAEQALFK